MPHSTRCWVTAVGIVILVLTWTGASQGGAGKLKPAKPRFVPGEILVKWQRSVPELERREVGEASGAARVLARWDDVEHVRLKPGVTTEQAIERLTDHPLVAWVEPNGLMEVYTPPVNDPLFADQWNLLNTGQVLGAPPSPGTPDADIDAELAWLLSQGSSSVIVASIDTGVDYLHEDLDGNMWTNPGEIPGNGFDDDGNGKIDDVYGWDFGCTPEGQANGECSPSNVRLGSGHGTNTTGVFGAETNNGFGVAGAAYRIRIMALKADDPGPSTWISNAAATQAVNYAIAKDADVINASWGGDVYYQALYEAISNANAAGILFVNAAGNLSADLDAHPPRYPQMYDLPNIVVVASTTHQDGLGSGTNWGAVSVDLGAPGSGIRTTNYLGGYGSYSGTSMAAPHVTAVAALMRAIDPNVSVAAMKSTLLANVDPLTALNGKTVTGGRLNAACTLEAQVRNGAPSAAMVAPNGGGTLTVGTTASIQWNVTDVCGGVSFVDIKVSRTGLNGTYDTILDDTYNDGVQNWVVTGPASAGFNVYFKVVGSDPAGHTAEDISNAGSKIVSCGLCQQSYCTGADMGCQATGSCGAGGCCHYTCGVFMPGCVDPECPPNVCGGCGGW